MYGLGDNAKNAVRLTLLVCLLLLSFPLVVRTQSSSPPKRVLVLDWYDRDHPWNLEFDHAFRARLQSASATPIECFFEYLETNRFPGEHQSQLLRDYLKQKYADQPIDIVVANSNTSLDFFLKYRDELFNRSPIVFVAAKNPLKPGVASSGITGIINLNAFKENLDLALALHPSTKQVFVISGTLERDKRFEILARQGFHSFEDKIEFVYLTDLSPEDLIARTKTLPEHSVILHVWQQWADERGVLTEHPDLLLAMARSANAPIYGMNLLVVFSRAEHSQQRTGIIGGYIASGSGSGAKVADIVVRIANGARAEDIAVEKAPIEPVFDWRELQRWGISESSLPPGSIVSFKELSLWEQRKGSIITALTVILGQTALIAWLIFERRRRWQAEDARRHLAAIVQSSTDAIIGTTLDGKILSWNRGAEALYGYSEAEILGRHLSIIVPSKRQKEFDRSLKLRSQGEPVDNFETIRVRKDGTLIEVSVGVAAIKDDRGRLIADATITRDISDRKRAEKELRDLAGRLITLQDEEQRRIAAELHDGLGQSLSLICNRARLGKERVSDPGSATEQFDQILTAGLSTIDEVREIARNLRPFELDRLGLITAVSTMTDKLSDATSIRVTSDLDKLDGLLTSAAETSIYRIVQEGLNNVVNHAEATEAHVRIKRAGSEIEISVQDNGKGIAKQTSVNGDRMNGFGLDGIAERARMLNGSYSLDSQPGHGTKITVRLDVKDIENAKYDPHSDR